MSARKPSARPRAPKYPADAFAGTAEFYAKYRPPYPDALLADLRARAATSGTGQLLDLACGTGEIALPLAPYFREAWALDLEPEMIEVGRRRAAAANAANITWRVGRAEDLDAPAGSFELVTIGNAYHRVDRELIAERAFEWLAPGGCFVLLFADSVFSGSQRWQLLAVEVIAKWTGAGRGEGRGEYLAPRHEKVLSAAGFEDIEEHRFLVPYEWTIDSFLGFLYSTSAASKARLGAHLVDFESDMRRTLVEYDSSGRYRETIPFAYILARKPAGRW